MLLKQSRLLTLPVILFYVILTSIFNDTFSEPAVKDPFRIKGEKHLRNIKMLTNGGENAEAYLSFNEKKLIYHATTGDLKYDQIFIMNFNGSDKRMGGMNISIQLLAVSKMKKTEG